MAGKSPVTVRDDQKAALKALASGADRAEADRARAILLTRAGWTSGRIAEAFGVREDTVRLWRGDFISGGVEALKARVAPGPEPLKAQAALRVGRADGRGDRQPRRGDDLKIATLESSAPKRGFRFRRPRHTLKGRQDKDAVDRVGLRLKLRKAQAEAGDIVLLFADESEALTHPYLARAWARRGADLRVPAPGQAEKVAMMGSLVVVGT